MDCATTLLPSSAGDSAEELLFRFETSLREIAREGCFALAYSGGLDSRFLAHAAQRLGFKPWLFHVVGPHIPPSETDYARDWARSQSFFYEEVLVDPLEVPLVTSGDRKRCYACKRELFSELKKRTSLPLCDGTNASDIESYRPGIQAVRELGILSPLAQAGLDKAALHRLAALTEMEHPEQKPRPCLLTRLPYGMKPERKLLASLADGERAIHAVLAAEGMPESDFRLRLVSTERMELHVLPVTFHMLSRPARESLFHSVSEVAPDLPPLHITSVETLSGFFDRT